MAENKNTGESLAYMLQSAMNDPRFGEILNTLKEKSDSGELDLNTLKGSVLSGKTEELASAVNVTESMKKGSSFENIGQTLAKLDDHKRLLAALKPYLSDNKKEAVDGILKIGQLGELAEQLGVLGDKK